MSPIISHRQPFIIYYHAVLSDKKSTLLHTLRIDPTTSMYPYFGETGYDIISRLQKDDKYLLFTHISLICPPDTKFIFEPPDMDGNGNSLKLSFFMGDMPQWNIPITVLNTIKRWDFCGEPIQCPPRQHFMFQVDGGDSRMWDGRDFWIALEGFSTQRIKLGPIKVSVGKDDDDE